MQLSISNQFKLYGILIVCVPFIVITLLGLVSYKEKSDENIKSLVEFGQELTQFNIQKNINTLDVEAHFMGASLLNSSVRGKLNAPIQQYIQKLDPQIMWSLGRPNTIQVFGVKPLLNCSQSFNGIVYSDAEGTPRLYYYIQNKLSSTSPETCLQLALPVDKKLRLQAILKHYAGFDLRIVAFSKSGATTVSASNNALKALDNDWIRRTPSRRTFHLESLGEHHLISTWSPLLDPTGRPVGAIIVSAPQTDFWSYFSDKLLYFWLTALLCFTVIILIGNRFHADWLIPIERIIGALQGVSLGNYSIRLNLSPRPVPLKQLQDNFNRILTVFEEEKKLRETFISCLAHDLKTPLYSQKRVIGALQTDNANFDDETKAILFNLMQTNNELYDLVQLLLESYRNDDVEIDLIRTPCDLQALITECISARHSAISKKNLAVAVKPINTINPILLDPLQIKRVITNLLQNAIEHSRTEGSIEFILSQSSAGTICTVQDNGPGISAENKQYIFKRYWSTKNRQQTLSSGLGLYIVRMIIEAHGGTITVDSELDKGTTFTIYLPKEETAR